MSKSNGTAHVESMSQPAKGRRFTEVQKQQALELVRAKVLPRSSIASFIGTTLQSLSRWEKDMETSAAAKSPPVAAAQEVKSPGNQPGDTSWTTALPPRSPYTPRDPGQGLGQHEVAAILELKRQHPSMGPAQIRAQLKRFKGWRVSNKAIARVLSRHGYERVHRGSRPKGSEPVRFEAPRRNALWQLDFAEVRVGAERLHVLVILDDFSRFVVGHALSDSPSSQVAATALRAAIARHGKPEAVRTDRGGAFVAFTKETDFGRYLEAELIDHIVGKSYSPQGGGKVERAIGTLRRELWEVMEFADRREAERRLSEFFRHYNERRAHMGIDGLTPADRFYGRADQVLATVDAISRKRQGAYAQLAVAGAPIEEAGVGGPLEVLRLVLVDGVMELRFCGARVRLGAVEVQR